MSNKAFQQNLDDKKGPQPGGPYLIQMLFKEPVEMPDKEKMTAIIYGVNTWAMSTYESRRGLARNYITPIIGDMLLSDITPRMMDKYYRDLLSVKTVRHGGRVIRFR